MCASATGRSPGVADFAALGTCVRLTTEPGRLDESCSRFRPYSELMPLAGVAGRPVQVSPLLAEAVSVALRAAALTDGEVEPTLGEALAAVGYDRVFEAVAAVGPYVRILTRPAPGWRRIRLDRLDQGGGLLTVPAGVQLDLGATAKTFAADKVDAGIAARLGCGLLVSLGGDEVTGPTSTVAITAGGLATSSTAPRRWVRGDRVLHHVLHPRTRPPAASPWRTVSVTAATCVDANTASTAAIVRGSAAFRWLRRLRLPARLVEDGSVVTVAGSPASAERPERTAVSYGRVPR